MRRAKTRVDSAVVPFHSIVISAFTSGVANFGISPNAVLSPTRLVAAADEWAHFRIKSLAFRLHPGTRTSAQIACAVGGVQDTPPATIAQAGEVIPSCFLAVNTTVPSEWCRVPPADLAGPLPWYKSVVGAADATEEAPGNFIILGTGSESFTLEAKGVFEFKTAVATGNTPMELGMRLALREERIKAHALKERQRLLAALAGTVSTATPDAPRLASADVRAPRP